MESTSSAVTGGGRLSTRAIFPTVKQSPREQLGLYEGRMCSVGPGARDSAKPGNHALISQSRPSVFRSPACGADLDVIMLRCNFMTDPSSQLVGQEKHCLNTSKQSHGGSSIQLDQMPPIKSISRFDGSGNARGCDEYLREETPSMSLLSCFPSFAHPLKLVYKNSHDFSIEPARFYGRNMYTISRTSDPSSEVEQDQEHIQTMPLWNARYDFEQFRQSCLPQYPILSLEQFSSLQTFALGLTHGIIARNGRDESRRKKYALVLLIVAINHRFLKQDADLRPQLAQVEHILSGINERKDLPSILAHVWAAWLSLLLHNQANAIVHVQSAMDIHRTLSKDEHTVQHRAIEWSCALIYR